MEVLSEVHNFISTCWEPWTVVTAGQLCVLSVPCVLSVSPCHH